MCCPLRSGLCRGQVGSCLSMGVKWFLWLVLLLLFYYDMALFTLQLSVESIEPRCALIRVNGLQEVEVEELGSRK